MIPVEVLKSDLERFNMVLRQYRLRARVTIPEALVKQGTKFAFALSRRFRGLMPGKGAITAERLGALKAGDDGVEVRESILASVATRYGAAMKLSGRMTGTGKYLEGVKSEARRWEIGQMVGKGKARKMQRGGSIVTKEGKRMNLQALAVAAELRARERGRGFLSYGSRIRGLAQVGISGYGMTKMLRHFGRYRQELANVGISVAGDYSHLEFNWGQMGIGFQKSKIVKAMQSKDAWSHIDGALREVTADMNVYLQRKIAEDLKSAGL